MAKYRIGDTFQAKVRVVDVDKTDKVNGTLEYQYLVQIGDMLPFWLKGVVLDQMEQVLPDIKEGTPIYVRSELSSSWHFMEFKKFTPRTNRVICKRLDGTETAPWDHYSLTNPFGEQ